MIRRYNAQQNCSITNAFLNNLQLRATGSNTGLSDVMQVFHIYGQASSASHEASRILLQFPINDIVSDRASGLVPASGSVSFILRLFNAPHAETLPKNFNLLVYPLSRSFEEGNGKDIDEFVDVTNNGPGANWINNGSGSQWTTAGGDYITNTFSYSQHFQSGSENMSVDISGLVEGWIAGTANNGIIILLSGSAETGSASYYNKKFFSRTSEFFFSRPIIEARWNSAIKDKRGKVVLSSSLLSSADNTNTIYLYNYFDGQLKNIPNLSIGSQIFVTFFDSGSGGTQIITSPTPITGGWVSTGLYSASFALQTTASIVYDRWFSGSINYYTGSFEPRTNVGGGNNQTTNRYVVKITNLKPSYNKDETARFRVFSRTKGWNPHIYSVATTELQSDIIENVYYRVLRLVDNQEVINYGTGSTNHTLLSYDVSGSYFDLPMKLFEPGYAYGIKFMYSLLGNYEEQPEMFMFRVDETL